MLLYAPAWLRRWRRPLVPPLVAVGALAFVLLGALPPFEEAPGEHAAALFAGAIAWILLVFLLNGEPLPAAHPLRTTTIDPAGAIAFDVRYDGPAAVAAQTEFWLRSVRELRFGATVIAPVAALFFFAVVAKVAPDSAPFYFFGAFAALSVISPIALFFVGRTAAAAQARQFPVRHVRVGREGIAVGSPEADGLAWSNVARVWESRENLTLVLNPFMAVQLPRAQVPEAARELMLSRAAARVPYSSRRW